MNRQQRRAAGIKTSEPIYNLRASDIERMKFDATRLATDMAFFYMLAIPVMVIHDNYGNLMRREGREKRFADLCLKLYRSYQNGYISIDDMKQYLLEETGLEIDIKGGPDSDQGRIKSRTQGSVPAAETDKRM